MKPKITNRRVTSITTKEESVQEVLLSKTIELKSEFKKHMDDQSIHTTDSEKNKLARLYDNVDHPINDDIHVTLEDKARWNDKESVAGAQAKADVVKSSLITHQHDTVSHMSEKDRMIYTDKYTRSEVDNKLKGILYGQNWLKPVNKFEDLAVKYKNAKVGDTCNVLVNKSAYTFNGKEWVLSNSWFTPMVTSELNGLMSKEDKSKLDTVQEGANNYIHPDDMNIRHVTDDQISKWDNKAENKVVTIIKDGLMSKEDKSKLDTVQEGANNYIHPDKHDPSDIKETDDKQFVSLLDKDTWNAKETVTGSQEKADNAVKESIRYTNNKIAGILHTSVDTLELLNELSYRLKTEDIVQELVNLISEKASGKDLETHILNENAHITPEIKQLLKEVDRLLKNKPNPDWNENDPGSLSFIKNKPTELRAKGGDADTISGYNLNQLMRNKKSSTVVVGTKLSGHTEFDVDFLCDGINDSDIIQKAIDTVYKNGMSGGEVVIREGEYSIKSTIKIMNNVIVRGSGFSTILTRIFDNTEPTVFIDDSNMIRDIHINNTSNSKGYAIIVNKNTNKLTNIYINGGGIYIVGSLNSVSECNIKACNKNGIYIYADNSTCYGNRINNNNILNSNIGIGLNSTEKSNHSNIIESNIIIDCNVGISLFSKIGANTRANNINNNTIYRGSGKQSDYTGSQHTIKIDSGANNIIHDNIILGKDALILGKNTSHNNIY